MKRALSCFAFTACIAVAATAQAGVDGDFDFDISNSAAPSRATGGSTDGAAILGDASRGDGNDGRSASGQGDGLDNLSGGAAPAAPRRSHVPSWQSLLPGSIQ